MQDTERNMKSMNREQDDCPYCHEPFKALYSESDDLYGIIEHKVFGVYADEKVLAELRPPYCPQCGRKLGED